MAGNSILGNSQDVEWSKWSDNVIAKACCVSQPFVSGLRPSYNGLKIEPVRKVERNGKTYEQNTANIGKAKPQPVLDDEPAENPEAGVPTSVSTSALKLPSGGKFYSISAILRRLSKQLGQ